MSSNFIDHVKIHCKSGKGGAGSAHLHRAKYIPKGGPDGGDGGRGGHVIIRGNSHLWTLLHLKYTRHVVAEDGKPGGKQRLTGANGKDIYIEVPLGTMVKDENGEMVLEILHHGEEKILLHGGKGGLGNWHFRSATHQTPRYAQPGLPGEEGYFTFELKILADVGLVGFPNAGKSTLLATLSAAKPKIANYPFTTLTPNLGIVNHRDYQSFVMADIPGIIEGAAEGKGIGHRFLRHIERNSVLLFLIPSDAEHPFKEYKILLNELEKYNPELLDKQRIISISKSDLIDEQRKKEIMAQFPSSIHLFFFSAVAQTGLQELKDEIWSVLHTQK